MDTLRLPAKIESLETFRSFVLSRAKERGVPSDILSKIELVLEEILTNIASYAYSNEEGSIELDCLPERSGEFRLRIADWGAPFDPLAQEDPDLTTDLSERQIGGLGIYLARQMADELSYRRENGRNMLHVSFLYGRA